MTGIECGEGKLLGQAIKALNMWTDGLAADWLNSDRRPRLVLSSTREVVWANSAAWQHLQPPQVAFIRNGRIEFADSHVEATFNEAVSTRDSASCRVFLRRATKGGSLMIDLHVNDLDKRRRLLLTCILSSLACSVTGSGVSKQFGLTRAESHILDGICAMESPSVIAKRLDVSVHTVRSHLRSIFDKTSVSSQLELLRLALAFEGI